MSEMSDVYKFGSIDAGRESVEEDIGDEGKVTDADTSGESLAVFR